MAEKTIAAKSGLNAQDLNEHSDAILERLLSLHPKSIDLSLARLERLLARLGHPERALPPVVHVAGTNGKGSVCAMVRAGLEAASARVHVYTSPHLTRFHERILVAGELIDEARLAALLAECEAANAGEPITFFEITTAAALLAFARTPAEWCVLEVGLGGRLDATNVVDRPAITAITSIDLDHQQFLGDTIAEIAGEKAGILKPGVSCVVAPQSSEATDAITATAELVDAPLLRGGADWTSRIENGRMVFEDADGLLDLPPPALSGRHQIDNAGVAVAVLRQLGYTEDICGAAVSGASWPARLHRLRRGPLVDGMEANAEIWLDGGHNPAAGAAIAAHFAELEERTPAPLYLICGFLNTKDPEGFLSPFVGLARQVFGIAVPGEANSLTATDVAQAAVRVGLSAKTAGSVEGALRVARETIDNDYDAEAGRILICGSLYLAGVVLQQNG